MYPHFLCGIRQSRKEEVRKCWYFTDYNLRKRVQVLKYAKSSEQRGHGVELHSFAILDVRGDVKYCQECLCCWTIQNNNTNKNCYLCKGVFQQPSCSSPQQRWVMKWDSLEVSVIISLQYETCMLRPCKWHVTRKELEVPCTTPQCQFQLQADRCCNTPGNVPGRLMPRTGLRSHHTHTTYTA